MIRHYHKTQNKILLSSLVFQIIILLFIIKNSNDAIFYEEILYLLNFTFYYIYLHFL